MQFLLDTHVWLWLLTTPERVPDVARRQLEDLQNELFLSAASSWEIAIKYGLGKLPLPEPPEFFVPARMQASGVRGLPIQHVHALLVAALPPHHRDPFDRLLIAQARAESFTLVTADEQILRYDVDCLEV